MPARESVPAPESLSIGAFARFSLLSQKALRLYDQRGLLRPAAVDPVTGYRSYHPAQLADARLIARLRRIDMPLERIAAVLQAAPDQRGALLTTYWAERSALHDRQGQVVRHLLRAFDRSEGPATMTAPAIQHRTVPAQTVISELRHLTAPDLPAWSHEATRRLTAIACAHEAETGPVFTLFHGDLSEEGDGPLELCVPVDPDRLRGVDVPMRTLPPRQEAYVALRQAEMTYPGIVAVHDAVEAWIDASGGVLDGPAREVYFPVFGQAPATEIVGEVAYAFSTPGGSGPVPERQHPS